jgi:hypothetical protein
MPLFNSMFNLFAHATMRPVAGGIHEWDCRGKPERQQANSHPERSEG